MKVSARRCAVARLEGFARWRDDGRFRRLRTPAHGVISSPVAPHTATLVRFDFYGDESGNEAFATKKGSYEMQIADPNAV
jgi:hypothetical protein